MANFQDSTTYKKDDDYYTPKNEWEKVAHLVPKERIIWECCMLNAHNSNSMKNWEELGYEVVGNTSWDFLDCDVPECDMIITNPPFSTEIKCKILKRLLEIDKPFIIVLNVMSIYSNYWRDIFGDKIKECQTIIPCGKIHYEKNGVVNKKTSFYSCFVAYKMDLSNEQLFLQKPKKNK